MPSPHTLPHLWHQLCTKQDVLDSLLHLITFARQTLHVCMCAQSLQSCPTLCDPMDYSRPASSAHGILQARILEWVAISSCRGSSWLRDRTHVLYAYLYWQVGSLPLAPPGNPKRALLPHFRAWVPHLLSSPSPPFSLLPPYSSSKAVSSFSPQGLCTHRALHLKHSSSWLCLRNSYSPFRSQFKPNFLKEELLPRSHMVP